MTDTATIGNQPLAGDLAAGLRSSVRDFARDRLPEIMVPSRVVVLPELPKLPNGKVDRARLTVDEVADDDSYVEPEGPDEVRIAQIWSDLLGHGRVSAENSFFDLGGDSLLAVQMAGRVRHEFGTPLSLSELFEEPTVRHLARMVGAGGRTAGAAVASPRSVAEQLLRADAELPGDIRPEDGALPASAPPYDTVLLTGATGYTGAFLLRELLDRGDAVVYALVRAADDATAADRVWANLSAYGLWRDGDGDRIRAVRGDLGRPYFGLSRSGYTELAEHVRLIVHNGALSSYALPYRSLKAINVLGTQEVLRLACRHRIKPVHFISSLAVFPGHPGVHHYAEDELADPEGVQGGYRQTKWVADRLVTAAGARGVPFGVYRAGLITGAQRGGACSTDTFLNTVMKGCIQLGSALDFDVTLEMAPVDFCAEAVAHIALSGRSLSGRNPGTCYHLPGANTVSWTELVDLLGECGYPLRREPYERWYPRLRDAVAAGQPNELRRFLPLFGEEQPAADLGYAHSLPTFGTERLTAALAGSGIACAPVDRNLLNTYLDYFVSTGYLPGRHGRG